MTGIAANRLDAARALRDHPEIESTAWPEDRILARRGGNWSRIGPRPGAVGLLRLLGMLSLLGPAVVLAGVVWQSRAVLLGEAADRAQRTAELLARHAAGIFDSYDVAFGRVEEHLRHAGGDTDEAALHVYLAGIDQGMKAVDALFVLDAGGIGLAHSRYLPVPKTSMSDREYMRDLTVPQRGRRLARIQGKGGLFFGAPVRSRYSGSVVLPVSRALRDATGRVTGAIVATVSQGAFADLYRTLALTEDDHVALVRADDRVLAQVPAAPGRPAVEPEITGTVPVAPDAGSPTGPLGDGGAPEAAAGRIVGLSKLEGYPVYAEVGYGTEAVLAPWRRQTLLNAGLAALAMLGLYALTRLALHTARTEARMQARVLVEANRRADAEAALLQSQKMEALGQLTGGIAHDFNNLLNIVVVNLELLRRRLSEASPTDWERLDAHARSACQGAERGVALTRRLLTFAHRQVPAPGLVQVADLLRGLSELLRQGAGGRASLTLDCPARLAPVRADPNALETALLNLVVNARDALPERGGRIRVVAHEEPGAEGPRRGGEPCVVLSVTDTGCGMDAALLARATEPFFTTKEVGKGSGLGLAMVERFAVQSGGRLVLESRVGEGTTVSIRLPVA